MGDVGIYARISLDRHDGEGVGRQLADCRELAATRGWDNVVEYVDNDLSAFRAKRRPRYDQMLEDLHGGRLVAVVAYHSDRLYRRLTDLETFIAAVQAAGAEVVTVKAGDLDLSTASGRMMAGILGSVSKHESERIGERVSRAKRERAAQGRPAGGGMRPFGLTATRDALVEAEAAELRQAAAAILTGASWASEVARLNDAGVRSTQGRYWTAGNLRRILTSPHVAGLRSYRGEIVGPASWPAILDRGTWELLRAEVAPRRRTGRPPSDRHLLTGILACSKCSRPLWANRTRTSSFNYQCKGSQTTTGRGCGGISISTARADEHVVNELRRWLQRPTFVAELNAWLAYGDESLAGARAELDEIEQRQVALAERWAEGAMPDPAYDAASGVLAQRRAATEGRLSGAVRRSGPKVNASDLLRAWDLFTVPERREAIRLVAKVPIVVGPGRDASGQTVPAGERLGLVPVWESG